MNPEGAVRQWDRDASELRHATAGSDEPDLVDSWLVDEGRARAVERHAARFSAACRSRHGCSVEFVGPFLEAVMRAIPRTGRWFPRIELSTSAGPPTLRLRLRGAPPPAGTCRLWVPGGGDPRREPRLKGPDLGALHGARARAEQAGADEALLLGPDGVVREGAFSAILWWREDALCTVPREAPVLDSVTKGLLLQIAAERGHAVRFEAASPDELDGLEVWSVSALHGIRAAIGWSGAAFRPAVASRATDWNARLHRMLAPLPR